MSHLTPWELAARLKALLRDGHRVALIDHRGRQSRPLDASTFTSEIAQAIEVGWPKGFRNDAIAVTDDDIEGGSP